MLEDNLLEGNKYFRWYWSICNRAKDRILDPSIYVEKHHIYPKSIYGQNKDLVKLTAKEHYIVHLLLWWGLRAKYGTKDANTKKMCHAFTMMGNPGRSGQRYKIKSSKEYSFLRLANSESRKGIPRTEKTKHEISNNHFDVSGKNNPMYGRCAYDIWVEKYGKEEADIRKMKASEKHSKTSKGVPKSEEFKKNRIGHPPTSPGIPGFFKNCHHKKESIEKISKTLSNKYVIKTPDNIIEIYSLPKLKEYLKIIGCSSYYFLKYKRYNDYSLISIESRNDRC